VRRHAQGRAGEAAHHGEGRRAGQRVRLPEERRDRDLPCAHDARAAGPAGRTYPHIAVQVGQDITIRNSDDTLHNIHPRPTVNTEFNIGQARQGMEATRKFDKEEIMIPVGCDVHPWMRSYIAVVNHPFFAVTGEDGTYEIKNVPAGDYEVEVIHEKLKTQSGKITVKTGEPAKLDLAYQG
jgi:hypothetical protein